MQYLKFTVENFKGIEKVEIDLVHNRILTLVGLNESGKTTVLEAMQLFYDFIKGKQFDEQETNKFRPKGIDFTGSVNISTTLKFEENDIKILERELKTKLPKKKFTFPGEFTYSFSFVFETHKYKLTKRSVTFDVKPITGKKTLHESNNAEWQALVTYVKENLVPEILFYEDFVFEIPEKIEFSISDPNFTGTGQIKNNNEWQLVLNDVLKSVNPKLSSFHEHLVKIWQVDSDTARNRLSQMERKLNDKITDAWKELFTEDDSAKKKKAQRINFKEINLVPHLEGDFLSFSFKVKTDSGKEFSMNERSKGCKWFFSFLIFTEFRKNRTKNILFLLDEPASNLHSSAQQKILNAIEQLSDSSVVVYSTHSHYMINPLWLSGAYVVINESISLDQLEGNITEEENAKITAKKYYNYVGSTKDSKQNLYFQPILDRLDYIRSPLDPAP